MAAANRIVAENALPGTDAWWSQRHAPPGALEAYATQESVRSGDRIELCVSTSPPARYRISIFRLGWYAGAGARLVVEAAPSAGLAHVAPPPVEETGLCQAGWPVTDSLLVADDWTPGQYAARLRLSSGPHAGTVTVVPFVVRRGPEEPAPLLVQIGVNTRQAYNHWGGRSLYPSNSQGERPAVKVSFDRPVPSWDEANLNARAPFHYDLPLIRFLEREGYDVGYQTDVDTHREPWVLMTARAIACIGHDEYWTLEMRDGFEAARDAGVHLAFLGANQCYWQVRYEDGERTLAEYRSKNSDPLRDPARKTVKWRDLDVPRPESEMIGVQYEAGITSPDALLTYEVLPEASSDPWGAAFSDRAPLPELVGYEWDGLAAGFDPPALRRFLHCADPRGDADCIRWRAPSGTLVFAAGSLGFAHAVDDWAAPGRMDRRVQSLLRNALDEMLG